MELDRNTPALPESLGARRRVVEHLTTCRLQQARRDTQHRRLTGTGWADDLYDPTDLGARVHDDPARTRGSTKAVDHFAPFDSAIRTTHHDSIPAIRNSEAV